MASAASLERTAHHGDVEIVYETIGPNKGVPLLLIMGAQLSMVSWPVGFIDQLVGRGFQVTRFDNRDAGRSTHFTHVRPASPATTILKMLGVPLRGGPAPYSLDDMAGDALAVLEAAGWESAHVVGISLGAAIAQVLAIKHPKAVRTLTSISSASPDLRRARMPLRGMWVLGRFTMAGAAFARSGKQLSAEVVEEGALRMNRAGMVGSPAYPPDETELRQRARAEWEYSKDSSPGHQGDALLASGNRLAGLRNLRLPSLIIHGGADIVAPLKGGQLIAKAIPKARLLTFSGMGHDLPYQLWSDIAEAIADLALGPDRQTLTSTEGRRRDETGVGA